MVLSDWRGGCGDWSVHTKSHAFSGPRTVSMGIFHQLLTILLFIRRAGILLLSLGLGTAISPHPSSKGPGSRILVRSSNPINFPVCYYNIIATSLQSISPLGLNAERPRDSRRKGPQRRKVRSREMSARPQGDELMAGHKSWVSTEQTAFWYHKPWVHYQSRLMWLSALVAEGQP